MSRVRINYLVQLVEACEQSQSTAPPLKAKPADSHACVEEGRRRPAATAKPVEQGSWDRVPSGSLQIGAGACFTATRGGVQPGEEGFVSFSQ
jgi:hypothetical protein